MRVLFGADARPLAISAVALSLLVSACGGGSNGHFGTITAAIPAPQVKRLDRGARAPGPVQREHAAKPGAGRRTRAPESGATVRPPPPGQGAVYVPREFKRRVAKVRKRFEAAQAERERKMASLPDAARQRLIRQGTTVLLKQLRLEGAALDLGPGNRVTVRVQPSRACDALPDAEKQLRRALGFIVPVVGAVAVRVDGAASLSAYRTAHCPHDAP